MTEKEVLMKLHDSFQAQFEKKDHEIDLLQKAWRKAYERNDFQSAAGILHQRMYECGKLSELKDIIEQLSNTIISLGDDHE